MVNLPYLLPVALSVSCLSVAIGLRGEFLGLFETLRGRYSLSDDTNRMRAFSVAGAAGMSVVGGVGLGLAPLIGLCLLPIVVAGLVYAITSRRGYRTVAISPGIPLVAALTMSCLCKAGSTNRPLFYAELALLLVTGAMAVLTRRVAFRRYEHWFYCV